MSTSEHAYSRHKGKIGAKNERRRQRFIRSGKIAEENNSTGKCNVSGGNHPINIPLNQIVGSPSFLKVVAAA